MKKLSVVFLSLLFLVLFQSAIAVEIVSVTDLEGYVTANWEGDSLVIKPQKSYYYMLIDSYGNPLTPSDVYLDMTPNTLTGLIKVTVESEDGVHGNGLLDSKGNVLVPAQYLKTEIVSERWQIGLKGVLSDANQYDFTVTDYNNNKKYFYLLDKADFYFDGQFAGSLGRADYSLDSANASGAYICVKNLEKNYVYYNNKMQASSYQWEFGSNEYDVVYDRKTGRDHYYHKGTGQEAFVPGCTLTADEVKNPYMYDRGIVYDLQGNELFRTSQNYDSMREFNDGYAQVKIGRLYGMIDITGKEIIPVEYDSFSYTDHPFYHGYIGAVKDGKFGFLDKNGNVTCDFVYSENLVRDYYTFATVKNLDGRIIVLSAAVGELPELYNDLDYVGRYYDSLIIAVKNDEGQTSLIDIYGNTLLPWDNYRGFEANHESSWVVVNLGSRNYQVLHFDNGFESTEEIVTVNDISEIESVYAEPQNENAAGGEADGADQADFWYRMFFDQNMTDAQNGDVTAQFNIGYAYDHGEGVAQDYSEAAYWYDLAARQGHIVAKCNLGYLYYHGLGVDQNYEKSMSLYCDAGEQGDAIAQTWCGSFYQEGRGVDIDYSMAAYWYQLAALQGNGTAQKRLGDLYRNGLIGK